MGEMKDARAPGPSLLKASCGVVAFGAVTAAVTHAISRAAASPGSPASPGLVRYVVVLVALASGLFLAAGVLRLAKWQLADDAHSALVGSALVIMGGLSLPLGSFARVFGGEAGHVVGPTTRCVATYVAINLVVRALRTTDVRDRDLPPRLLPRLFLLVGTVFLVLLAAASYLPWLMSGEVLRPTALAVASSLGWLWAAALAALRSRALPWAGRAAPLFLGMGLAEALRGLDVGAIDRWTLSGVLMCASMAALAARSALTDLVGAVRTERHHQTDLAVALHRASDEADELSEWREQLTHDARNACAGLRTAMEILQRYDGRVDPGLVGSLRVAALQEIGHLEHLLTRSSSAPCSPFDVNEVAHALADAACSLGADVRVIGDPADGIGRPGDLAAVLKHLLVNAETHAPGSRIEVRVVATADRVALLCSDDGPGLSAEDEPHVFERGYRGTRSAGSGLGLHAARELMRGQGGELELIDRPGGASFMATLPAAVADRPAGATPFRVPAQRIAPPRSDLTRSDLTRSYLTSSDLTRSDLAG